VDAIILAILPVLALYGTRSADAVRSARGRLSAAAAALIGSALITAAYHLGFREFQGPQLALPVLGGVLTTLTYLVSGSIAAPIVAHVVMHAAAVLHGAATTVQLPPHY
jgi:membrane protease YdiL (CAAX protease family)